MMKVVINRRFLKVFLRKLRKIMSSSESGHGGWTLLSCKKEEEGIPKDVPKGHMVVYVGEECKRFVIRVASLHHPLFRALLDQAREVYQFNPDAKLCIPCDESFFVNILRDVGSQQTPRIWMCF